MQTYEPNLALFRQAFGNDITDCRAELIKSALGWSRVYRVALTYKGRGHPTSESVIVKTIDSNGPIGEFQAERELRFYETLHPKLTCPKAKVHYLQTDEETGFHIILMEDLSSSHRIPAHPYQWTRDEMKSVLRAYAQLHTAQFENLNLPWLVQRHENLLDFDRIPEQVAVVRRAGIWGDLPQLQDLLAYARESCRKYRNETLALIHGDTTPANAALPRRQELALGQPAILIDWQDVGVGMPEFDLAYVDLQPFHSARLIPRPDLLEHYWHFRAEIDHGIPSPEERRARQLHADVVTALWLTAPASRVTLHPFPSGSDQQIHWASQYDIVYNRLKSLADEIIAG